MIRPHDLVSLSDLFSEFDERAASTEQARGTGQSGERAARVAVDRTTARAGWRAGWPALLVSSAARSVLALLLGMLLASLVPALPGWHPSVVQTGSMRPLLQPGDVVVARPVPVSRLRPGQVLLVSDPDQQHRLRLHRLVRFAADGSLVLRGDANPADDSSPVPVAAVHGVAVLRIPGVGLPMLWARQDRYLRLGALGLLLGCLLLLAVAYRPPEAGSSQADPPRADPSEDGSSGRRRRHGLRRAARPAAASVLAVLAMLQLAHPPPAQARFVGSTAGPADQWSSAAYYSCRQAVLASNPVLYYRLEEASGSTVNDSSGAAATGTYSSSGVSRGQPGTCDYDGGSAVRLNGSTGYLYRNSQTSAPSTFSWELWFATSTAKGGWLIGMGSSQTGSSSTTDRQLYLTNAGEVGFGVLSSNKMRTVLSAAGYNDGGWHLADATFSASTGMRLYLDGQLVASNSSVTSAKNYSGYLRIGYDNLTGWTSAPLSNFLAGTIDEVSAYSTVLSATQIGYHYAAGS